MGPNPCQAPRMAMLSKLGKVIEMSYFLGQKDFSLRGISADIYCRYSNINEDSNGGGGWFGIGTKMTVVLIANWTLESP